MSNARENVNLLTSADWDIAALRLANWGSGAVPPQVMLKQNWAAGDGGGLFRYDASDTTTADDGGTVIVDAAGNRWKRQDESWVRPEWFGAKAGDQANAVQAANVTAFTAALNSGKSVLVGIGDYWLNGQVLVNDRIVTLRGTASRNSRLIWTNAAGGIRVFDNTQGATHSTAYRHYVGHLSLMTTEAGGGQPLYIRASGYAEPSVVTEFLHVTGYVDTTDYWTDGIQYHNVFQTKTSHLYYQGKQQEYNPASTSNFALKISQDSGLGGMAHWIDSPLIKFVDKGIDFTHSSSGSNGLGIEGIVVRNPLIISRTCIHIEDTNVAGYLVPYVTIEGGQLDANIGYCLYVKSYAQVFVDNTVMYGDFVSTSAPLVEFDSVQDWWIQNTWFGDFQGSGTGRVRVGFRASGTTKRGRVENCKFENLSTAIDLGASTENITIGLGQRFVLVTDAVANAGATNIVESDDNFLSPTAQPAGNAVPLRALGSDTNINLQLMPKGTGIVYTTSAFLVAGAGGDINLTTDGSIELARTAGSPYIDFKDANADDADVRLAQASNGLNVDTGGNAARATRWHFGSGGVLRPADDNTYDLGTGSFRVREIFAGNTMINPSDERMKVDIEYVSPALKRAARRIRLRTYRWRDAKTQKGDGARYHVGVIHQEVEAAFRAEGLNPWAYGVLCVDPIVEPVTLTREIPQRRRLQRFYEREITVRYKNDAGQWATRIVTEPVTEDVVDENGRPVWEEFTVTETYQELRAALDEFGEPLLTRGVRYGELYALLLATLLDDASQ